MTLVIVRRDLQVFILAVGHLFDLVVNKALKTWFAQARPPGDGPADSSVVAVILVVIVVVIALASQPFFLEPPYQGWDLVNPLDGDAR